ncbi:MAG: exopolyphosphatase [Rhodospirillaceae bacterium]|mgnify:FL=1|nr:exopolyphosphatase [Rhodospirillales bacterium]MBT3907865.1 exopolyphosphatase [Rhodospirillaceae bacterium]MBT4703285.1 exopolyphosphatase [Rhodospirillaceae bacterium]MBT5035700.1 exopolyphosphatase [Rhodospirillaceae bacterium]MBT6218703.1 exopolyphosphatase [Rhodospirillaceae bacterium]
MSDNKFRLITRSDFDGLVCAVLLKELDMVDEIKFVHPKDMQDGTILVSDRDISTNLPYVKGVHLAFDHHLSETVRLDQKPENHIIDSDAPSAARVVYDYYGGKKAFANISDEMMVAVDKSDSAQFNEDEILNPTGWVLLNFIMDARTGLGRYRDFRVSNYQLMMELIDYCRDHTTEEILELPDVKERTDLYNEHQDKAKGQIKKCSTIYENLAVLDLREEEIIYAGNRFLIYALFPDINISMHAIWGLNRLNTVFAVGKSILNRSSNTNIGDLMLQYGGGGHLNAGTCQVDNDESERVEQELIDAIISDG